MTFRLDQVNEHVLGWRGSVGVGHGGRGVASEVWLMTSATRPETNHRTGHELPSQDTLECALVTRLICLFQNKSSP